MPKEKTKTAVGMKLDNELLERLDRYQSSLPYQTTRTALVEAAIEQMLDREAKVVDLARRRK
jgi:predicted transcriptional regulator